MKKESFGEHPSSKEKDLEIKTPEEAKKILQEKLDKGETLENKDFDLIREHLDEFKNLPNGDPLKFFAESAEKRDLERQEEK